jgi:NAD(P)-dependent dehydrogenase (short-subunit alcohol dehydrogenase family)
LITGGMAVRQDVQRLADEAIERFGRVDILVNNAGWNIVQAIDEIRDEDWDYLVDWNLSHVMALPPCLVVDGGAWSRVF